MSPDKAAKNLTGWGNSRKTATTEVPRHYSWFFTIEAAVSGYARVLTKRVNGLRRL